MGIEMKMLVWAMVLGLVQIGIAATLGTQQRGLGWNVGARDGVPVPLTGVAGRLDRASRNFLETFPFFAAAVLAVVALQAGNEQTALGAQLYFWGRVAYFPVYAMGISYVRTAIWAVSLAGLLMVLRPLLG
ncbi:MAPEG family protein [soil metagenome]